MNEFNYYSMVRNEFMSVLLSDPLFRDGEGISRNSADGNHVYFFDGIDSIPTGGDTSLVWTLMDSNLRSYADNQKIVRNEYFMIVLITSNSLRSNKTMNTSNKLCDLFLKKGWQVNSVKSTRDPINNKNLITFTVSRMFSSV